MENNKNERIVLVSYILMALSLFLILYKGLLPALLSICLGYLLSIKLIKFINFIFNIIITYLANKYKELKNNNLLKLINKIIKISSNYINSLALIIIIFSPILLVFIIFFQTKNYVIDAPQQYRELLEYLSETVLQISKRLPEELVEQLPQGINEIQNIIATFLASKAGTLVITGRTWLGGFLLSYIGFLIGGLIAIRPRNVKLALLTNELQKRIKLFSESFRQIVTAQFWIALFNASCTSIFLFFILPKFQLFLPYSPALVLLTFIAGLIPIIGNLFCNFIITLVGLSVSFKAGIICLLFLILIHKAEYFINAKVIGQKTKVTVWELLSVMFVMEGIFGPAGLVAAPLFYAYLKKELEMLNLV